jgi:hypothetical protein
MKQFTGYKDWAQIIPELAIGRTDAALFDQPVVAALMKQHPEWKIELVEDYDPRTFKTPWDIAATHSASPISSGSPRSPRRCSGCNTTAR